MSDWDVIVIGLGGVGSAAASHLSAAGQRVLGIDRYQPPHDRGSSHGRTRVIRQAYFEHPAYVPLLRRAYELWDDLERRSQQQLFHRTGLIEVGPPDGVVVAGVHRSAQQHGLPVQRLSMAEVARRWPGLAGDEAWEAAFEQNAGYLRVEACVQAHLSWAEDQDAMCRHQLHVRDWRCDGRGVRVSTDAGTETAARLVIAAGPWASTLLGQVADSEGQPGLPLAVLRKHQYWLHTTDPRYEVANGFPCFFYETSAGYFYGFPSLDGNGVKVARHSGGEPIDGPRHSDAIDEDDFAKVRSFTNDCLPGVTDRLSAHAPCYYTMTPDEHFVIDRVGPHEQVIVIAGLSGHGFKFTSVLGEIAADLAGGETPPHDLSLFRIARR